MKTSSTVLLLAALVAFAPLSSLEYAGNAQSAEQNKNSNDDGQKQERPGVDEVDRNDDDDRNTPVIHVHYDYMVAPDHNHKPSVDAIQMVVDRFRAHGIKLKIDPHHTAIPETEVVTFRVCASPGSVDFYDLKAQYFRPRGNHPWHYAIFGHSLYYSDGFGCSPLSGVAEIGGDDFVMGTEDLRRLGFPEGGLFMHELGHNLNLNHGGPSWDETDLKPNYLSVMNQFFTFRGIPYADSPGSLFFAGRRLDYSDQELATLDERHLDERIGINAGTNDITRFFNGLFQPTAGVATGPIDWNGDGVIEPDVSVDVNLNDLTNGRPPSSILYGHDDWAAIHQFLNTPAYRNSVVEQNPAVVSCVRRR